MRNKDLIERVHRLEVLTSQLSCSHSETQFHTYPAGGSYYERCASCGKTIQNCVSEIVMLRTEISKKEEEIKNLTTRLNQIQEKKLWI